MLTFTQPMRSLLAAKCHRQAKLWEIRLTNGTVFRLTDHNRTLDYEGFTYTPTGGGYASAKQRLAGLDESNSDFMGVITSSAVTFDDLWAGRFREAEVLETRVDWRYPYLGRWDLSRYWIQDIEFDGETWKGKFTEFPMWLGVSNGDVYGRTCRWSVYQPGCGVSPGGFAATTASTDVDAIITPYLKFERDSIANPQSSGYYNGGDLLWITGRNAGIRSQIKTYLTGSPPTIELQLKTPLPIQVGDQFNFWRGCNKLFGGGPTQGDCVDVFNNGINFGGFNKIPGPDEMMNVKR